MKKLLLLLICLSLILPCVPAFAADRTNVIVSEYNNIDEDLIVTVNTANNAFSGATIEVGSDITYTLEGSGKGNHTAVIDLSSFPGAGKTTLRVTANYGGDSDVVEKEIVITKMESATTEFTKSNLNVTTNIASSGVINYEALDAAEKELKLTYSAANNTDVRLGRSDADNVYTSGGNYIYECEFMFKNGDSPEKQQPGIWIKYVLRQSTSAFDSGYPYNSSTGAAADESTSLKFFYTNGKLAETGENYYTNVWYKVRYEIDSVTKDSGGKLVGGLKFYVAKDEGEGYGDYQLIKNYPYYTLENISQFRFEFKSTLADASVTIKNMSLTKDVPVDSWNFLGWGSESDKIDLEFSEDLGALTSSDVKVFNKLNCDENGKVLYEEIEVASIENKGEGKYSLILKNPMLYGENYDICLKNGFKSVSGAVAFKEPKTDENGDGMWCVATITSPAYYLNIYDIYDNGSSVYLSFASNSEKGEYAAVCWFDGSDNMVDCAVAKITATNGDPQTFLRGNNKEAAYFKAFVFAAESNSENKNFGADTVYDIY